MSLQWQGRRERTHDLQTPFSRHSPLHCGKGNRILCAPLFFPTSLFFFCTTAPTAPMYARPMRICARAASYRERKSAGGPKREKGERQQKWQQSGGWEKKKMSMTKPRGTHIAATSRGSFHLLLHSSFHWLLLLGRACACLFAVCQARDCARKATRARRFG